MKTILWTASLILVLTPIAAFAQPKPQLASERTSVDLTVYNMNLALIREERTINLEKGFNRVVIPEIPATIDGTSLHFQSTTDASSVRVLEQNFQYDLVHHGKLMEKYVGKDVEFVRLNEQTKQEYSVKGRLLATGWQQQQGGSQYYSTGQMIAEVNGKVEINPGGRLVLPSLPEGLILKPQLEWLVNSTKAGQQKTEISYLAHQLSWNCNYVALLDAKDEHLNLTGWVTLTNNSGTTFKDAGLKLVAGDVNMIRQNQYDQVQVGMSMRAAAEPQFTQKELFEYKLYALQRRTNLANTETKQIELASASNVTATKVFVYDGLADSWRGWYRNSSYRDQGSFGQQSNSKVGVFVVFRNDEKSGLGIPLPKGKVRVYKRDDDNKEQFIGEDEIDHTPKDEELKLYLGNAFDVTGSRVQKDFRTIVSGHLVEETFEIKVRNHKSDGIEVLVYEHPWRWNQWEIVKTNTEWQKVDQTTVKFAVKLKKDEEKTITYSIRYSW